MTPLEQRLCAAITNTDPFKFGEFVDHIVARGAHNAWRNSNVTVANPIVSVIVGREKLERLLAVEAPSSRGIRIYFTNSIAGLRDVCIVPVDNVCKNIITPIALQSAHSILNTSTPCPDICEPL